MSRTVKELNSEQWRSQGTQLFGGIIFYLQAS